MCHILCFLTGAGLATYLARRRRDPLYEDGEDVYYGDRMRERERNATGNPGNPGTGTGDIRGIEHVGRKQQQQQQERDLRQDSRARGTGTGERGGGAFRRSVRKLSKVTEPLVEFFENVGDALDGAARERQARRTTATTAAEAPQPQPQFQAMAEKSPLPEAGGGGRAGSYSSYSYSYVVRPLAVQPGCPTL
ncbi:hypothetical protein PC9H_006775 [Pleurotus ostreatus]|uniref:Uncharacterized protein n=1 Tax=Pleurotus ostreatus TaxID=5322 RepID=A0A8H7DVX1_PLEOS|nr:uncharacterized protein PC9H_006775 [Pleurotus ostreatus]KAF7431057.1 hypothetical protein PC9H_006775 [Pleurotus ostreatus]